MLLTWKSVSENWPLVLTVLGAAAVITFIVANVATPEKALERKLSHKYKSSDPQFRREMGLMLGPTIIEGNSVRALQNGDEIFPEILNAINAARETINFETYIYWSGEIGQKLADALAERAKSGVKVNVLIDWVGSIKMDEALLSQIQSAGAVVHRYRPLSWYNLGRLNNRTHRKLLVIDGKIAFTGGVGIADQWKGSARSPDEWRDLHFKVEGPAVAQFQSAFNDNWIKTTGAVLNGPLYFPQLDRRGDFAAHLFVSSPSGGSESMHLMYMMAIAAAEHRIDLQAAYFVPDDLTMSALIAAKKRGVAIRITLPGKHIDSDAVRIASKAQWGALLAEGIEIFEYQPTMLHNKLLIVDDALVSVGSTNFDERSFRLNDEASLNVYNAEFAQVMRKVFEADLVHCVGYTYELWQQRPLKEKLIERVILPIRSQL
jgi:cardiolipin synthase A/B